MPSDHGVALVADEDYPGSLIELRGQGEDWKSLDRLD